NHDFIRNPVFMNKLEGSEEFSEESFTENFDVVFVDNSGKLNLLSGMTKTALEQIQHEARIAMEYFNENEADRFEALFLQKVNDTKLRYDNVAKITQIPTSYCNYTDSVKLDYHDPFVHFARTILVQLKQGLTNRVSLITINYAQLPTWSISSVPPSYSSSNLKLYIGLVFNPEQSNRLIDYGPSPEDETAASQFRKLWGKKAEVRRFKDGSILECVVWDVKGIEERCLIVSRIVKYLLHLHYGINESKGIQYFTGQLNDIVIPSTNIPKSIYNKNGIANGFRDVMQAFDKLVKQFMALEDVPLRFSGIRAASSTLRYASIFIPQPLALTAKKISHYVDPIEVIIQFEHSVRWPDDIVTIQKMKIAFYIRLASQLELQFPGTCATVVTDNSDTIISEAYMDILADSGFAFRCRIYNEREMTLLDRGIKDKISSQLKKDTYTKALEREKRMFVEIPMHTLQIQTLCNKWPSLSLTIRLTKRWFSTHLLSDHVDEEWIECLSSQVYLEPLPWNRPSSGFVGFLRVLKLIASWDWNNEAMIVNL
ncbi:9752_t:CDS:2, partial [Racocetra persica]